MAFVYICDHVTCTSRSNAAAIYLVASAKPPVTMVSQILVFALTSNRGIPKWQSNRVQTYFEKSQHKRISE
jgi:hypothetical protein